jgi:hypothetical protein
MCHQRDTFSTSFVEGELLVLMVEELGEKGVNQEFSIVLTVLPEVSECHKS